MDGSDKSGWARSEVATVFIKEVRDLRDSALRGLLKCKAQDHDQWKESYSAYDKVLRKFEDYAKSK